MIKDGTYSPFTPGNKNTEEIRLEAEKKPKG